MSEWTETMRIVLMSRGSPVLTSHSRHTHSKCRSLVHHCPKATAACRPQATALVSVKEGRKIYSSMAANKANRME